MVMHVTAYIASHYREGREPILGDVLDALGTWEDAILDVTVMSNVPTYGDLPLFAEKKRGFEAKGFSLKLEVVSDLANPRHLTWAHKKYMPAWAETASQGEDFFVYIEDDILISKENFRYFVTSLKKLKPEGLIPGFLRTEFNENGERHLMDLIHVEYWQRERTRRINGKLWHACQNPYWAGFIMDRDLAREYVASPSFDIEKSAAVHHWNVQERSAMGLTYEKPPRDLRSRVVIPLVDGQPEADCLVWHRSNNYVTMKGSPLGKKKIDRIFRTETLPEYILRKARRAIAKVRRG